MVDAPHAPWALRGEVIVALVGSGGSGGSGVGRGQRLPTGVRALPGPALVVGCRYSDSPVGPYLELSVAEPARLGVRPGWCVTAMVVSEAAAKVGNRLNWGMPASIGALEWSADADTRVLRWSDGGVEVRAVCGRLAVPAVLPMRSVQGRGDGPVLVPRRLSAMLRLARVSVAAPGPGGDEASSWSWSWLAGEHRGAVLSSARLLVRPARHPSGVLSSFRAPLQAPEPRLSYRPEAAAEALQ